MLTPEQLDEFELLLREYFDPKVEELPSPKYLSRWAVQHGEELLTILRTAVSQPICPGCCHPRCEANCAVNRRPCLPYVPDKPCPCCMFQGKA